MWDIQVSGSIQVEQHSTAAEESRDTMAPSTKQKQQQVTEITNSNNNK